MEGAILVTLALGLEAELPEVLSRLGHDVGTQLHDDAADDLAIGRHVEIDLRVAAQLERLVHGAARPIDLLLHEFVERLASLVLLLHLATRLKVGNLLIHPRLGRLLILVAPQPKDSLRILEQRRCGRRHFLAREGRVKEDLR